MGGWCARAAAVLKQQEILRKYLSAAGLPTERRLRRDVGYYAGTYRRATPRAGSPTAKEVHDYISHLYNFPGANVIYDFRFGQQSGALQSDIVSHWDAEHGRFVRQAIRAAGQARRISRDRTGGLNREVEQEKTPDPLGGRAVYNGAETRNRTGDPRFFRPLLYRTELSRHDLNLRKRSGFSDRGLHQLSYLGAARRPTRLLHRPGRGPPLGSSSRLRSLLGRSAL